MQYLHSDITGVILKGFYTICSTLSSGLELSIYKNAIRVELEYLGLKTEENKKIEIVYRNTIVGNLYFDFLINDCVGLNITNIPTDITDQHVNHFRTYLKETKIEVGLILNFGIEAQHKRIFLGNDFKKQN